MDGPRSAMWATFPQLCSSPSRKFASVIRLSTYTTSSSTYMAFKKLQNCPRSTGLLILQSRSLRTKVPTKEPTKPSSSDGDKELPIGTSPELLKNLSKQQREFFEKMEKMTGQKIKVIKAVPIPPNVYPKAVFSLIGSWVIMLLFTIYLYFRLRYKDFYEGRDYSQLFATNPIPFDVFLDKFLQSGEVDKVVLFPFHKKAIAMLHPGAVINGRPFGADVVAVNLENVQKDVNAAIRDKEDSLGIAYQNRVPIDFVVAPAPYLQTVFYVYIGFSFLMLFMIARKFPVMLKTLKNMKTGKDGKKTRLNLNNLFAGIRKRKIKMGATGV